MTERTPMVILGAGGHARAILDIIRALAEFEIVGFIDPACELGTRRHGVPILATEDQLSELVSSGHAFAVGVGHMMTSAPRARIFTRLRALSAHVPTLIAPTAYVSADATVGTGTQVMHGAIVNAGARVEQGCILNSRSLVEHDARVGRGSHISTGAIVNGGAAVGARCLIGSSATVLQGRKITDDVIVGAGAVVIRDITSAGTYVGIPARRVGQ